MAMITAPADLFNMATIYNEKFSYSLPRSVLESFGKGLGFPDNKVEYTAAEIEDLQFDIMQIWKRIQSRKLAETKEVILTAGAPGVGKTLLEREMWENDPAAAYICPDDVCLKEMEKTYQAMVAKDPSAEGRRAAYNKWRAASNYAHHIITANLIRLNQKFYFGTTASGDKTYLFLDFLKKNGYTIRILYVSAPDQVRFDSIAKRDQVFIQTTNQDVLNKQLMVHERVQDTFVKYADQISFYFRTAVDEAPKLAARWIMNDGKGKLHVVNPTVYAAMTALHDQVCDGMKKPEHHWANTFPGN